MKIIKENKNFGEQHFECENCGTVFSAKRGEYVQTIGYIVENKNLGLFGLFDAMMKTEVWNLDAKCPACGTPTTVKFPTEKPPVRVYLD